MNQNSKTQSVAGRAIGAAATPAGATATESAAPVVGVGPAVGAAAAAKTPIPFARPILGPEEERAVVEVLRSGWLTTGKQCLGFEQEFGAKVGMPFALAVNSATSGLHLALEALGIGPGDHIAVSPYTFTASCEVMRYLGAHPHFVDIEADSFHMDPDLLERELEKSRKGQIPAIKAVMLVHIGGVGRQVRRTLEICRAYAVPVVEDAAHAFPARGTDYGTDGRETYLGCGGEIGVYSFYANKTITTGEGGMIVCRDPELAARMKIMRSHGIDRDVWRRFTDKAEQWRYEVVEPGFKYNMPDMAAAIGRVQLTKADDMVLARREIAAFYARAFDGWDWLRLPPGGSADELGGNLPGTASGANTDSGVHTASGTAARGERGLTQFAHSWHLYALRIRDRASGSAGRNGGQAIDRDGIIRAMSEAGIGTSVHYIPLHIMPYFVRTYGLKPQDFPGSLAAFESTFSLPIYPGLSETDLQRVVEELRRMGDTA